MEKQFSLQIALDNKSRYNKAASSYMLPQLFVFSFSFLAAGDMKRFLVSLQTKNF